LSINFLNLLLLLLLRGVEDLMRGGLEEKENFSTIPPC